MERMNVVRRLAVRARTLLAVVGAAVLAYWALAGFIGRPLEMAVSAQGGDMYLSRRIDQVENRFYGIESRLNRLESQSRVPAITPPSISNPNAGDTEFLRNQIDALRLRLGEAECALLKLDERTLTPTARTTRKKASSVGTDRCREERDAPVRLSARP